MRMLKDNIVSTWKGGSITRDLCLKHLAVHSVLPLPSTYTIAYVCLLSGVSERIDCKGACTNVPRGLFSHHFGSRWLEDMKNARY